MPLKDRRRTGRLWRRILVAWIVVFTALVFFAIGSNREIARDGRRAESALCALRASRERSLDRTIQYLRDHPRGVPGFVTVEELQASIVELRQVVRALSELDCPKGER